MARPVPHDVGVSDLGSYFVVKCQHEGCSYLDIADTKSKAIDKANQHASDTKYGKPWHKR